MDNKQKSLFKTTLNGLLWMFSSTGTQAILQAIVLVVLARLLTPEAFGIVSAAVVIISFSNIFTTLGVGPAIIQRKQLNNKHIYTGFTTTILLNLILGSIVFFFSPIFALFFGIEELREVLKVLSLLFIIRGFGIVPEYLVRRNLKFKFYSILNVCSYAAYGFTGIALAFMGFGVCALVAAHISRELFKTIALLIKQPHTKKIGIEVKEFKELYYYGSGVSIASVFNQLATQGDNLVVGKFLGAEALGLYTRAYQLMVMPANLFGTVMDRVLFPAMSRIQDDIKRVSEWYITSITLLAIVILPISIFIAIMAEQIVLILFGEGWEGVVIPLQILSIGLLFRTSYKISDSLVRAMGAAYRRAWRQAIYAISILS